MRRRWLLLMFPLLLVGGWMWLMQFRLTPEGAVRSINWVRGQVVQTARFPGGVALLLTDGRQHHAYAACRRAPVFWQPCGGTGCAVTEEKSAVVTASAFHSHGNERLGFALLAGVARDEQISGIAWSGQERDVTQTRHFLFAKISSYQDAFTRATALSITGQELYEWGSDTWFQWQPVGARD